MSFSGGHYAWPGASEWAAIFGGIPTPSSTAFFSLCQFCDANTLPVDAALPWLAAEIGRNDGYATMLGFIHRWSGTRLYVPRSHARFVERVGCELGIATHARLVRDVGVGSQVEVPSAWGVFLALRRTAIAIAVDSRMPRADVSRCFGVTMRSLR